MTKYGTDISSMDLTKIFHNSFVCLIMHVKYRELYFSVYRLNESTRLHPSSEHCLSLPFYRFDTLFRLSAGSSFNPKCNVPVR